MVSPGTNLATTAAVAGNPTIIRRQTSLPPIAINT